MRHPYFRFAGLMTILLGTATYAFAAEKSADRLFPASTKGYVVIPDVQRLQQSWDRISIGKLAADPVVKPFMEDIERQIRDRVDRTGIRFGLSIEDLIDVCAGEVALAMIEPSDGTQKHASAAIADITGKEEEATRLLETVRKSMEERNATLEVKRSGDVELQVYTVPLKKGAKRTFTAVLFRTEDRLVGVDHEEIALQILGLLRGGPGKTLADQPNYLAAMQRANREPMQDIEPHLKWFVEPIAYAKLTREAAAVQRKSRNDMLEAVSKQGFDAISGLSGLLYIEQGDFELLHQSFALAPPAKQPGMDRFEQAARVLEFPGTDDLSVEPWVPIDVNSYGTATWDIQKAYQYIGTLVDEIAGEEGFWDDLKESLKEDPNGPMIDLDKDIIAYLGTRVSIITDSLVPITTESERFLVAISLTNADAMEKSISRALRTDPDARLLEIDGKEIWEIINEEVEAPVSTDASAFAAFGDFGTEAQEEEEENKPLLMTNSAISVIHGQLMIASHVDFLVEVMRRKEDQSNLATTDEYQSVHAALRTLGAEPTDTATMFSRSDEELQASYELIREGRMPESKGLLGQLLNRVLGPKEKGVVREQEIEGDKMPEYDKVRKYLGPVGIFISTDEDGWYSAGIGLAPNPPKNPMLRPKLSTADRTDREAN